MSELGFEFKILILFFGVIFTWAFKICNLLQKFKNQMN